MKPALYATGTTAVKRAIVCCPAGLRDKEVALEPGGSRKRSLPMVFR